MLTHARVEETPSIDARRGDVSKKTAPQAKKRADLIRARFRGHFMAPNDLAPSDDPEDGVVSMEVSSDAPKKEL